MRGWGKVSIPADANPADNDDWFVFDEPAPRQAIVVAEDPLAARPLQLAAAICARSAGEMLGRSRRDGGSWRPSSGRRSRSCSGRPRCPMPTRRSGLPAFIERGGQVLFFPPRNPGPAGFQGIHWTAWIDRSADVPVESWRGDQDLLAQTQSGGPLPVGQLQVRKYCGLAGELTALATLRGGATLLGRITTSGGGAYFCATTPAVGDSSLATSGVVLYVLVQRALAQGAKVLGNTRELTAGDPAGENPAGWKRLAGAEEALSTDYPLHRGIYRSAERLLAVSRAAAEDLAPVLADGRVAGLFRGLDLTRVDDRAGNLSALDPGNLAAVPGRDDGGDGGRGGPLPASQAPAGRHVMSVSRSLTFLWTPWSLGLSILLILITAGLGFVAWRRSGYSRSMGLLELLRLALVAIAAALLNQPSGSRNTARRRSRRSPCSGMPRPAWRRATSWPGGSPPRARSPGARPLRRWPSRRRG